MLLSSIKDGDWTGVRKNFQKLGSLYLGNRAAPKFADLTLTNLTASRLVYSDANKKLTSVSDLTSWIAGTANEVDITDDGDGTITIGIVNPLIVAKGGIGTTTLTDHGILLGSGTGAITPLDAATDGQLPIGSTGADPVLAGLTGTENQITVTNAAGSITLSLPQDYDTGAIPTLGGLITTGTIDASAGTVLVHDNDTAEPTGNGDGYIGVAIVDGDPRIYFTVAGNMYYVCNDGVLVGIQTGNPIGLLLTLTYA